MSFRIAQRKSKPIDKALLNIESWLTARKVVSLSMLDPVRECGPYGEEVQLMLPVYDRLTEFRSPMKWVDQQVRVRSHARFASH